MGGLKRDAGKSSAEHLTAEEMICLREVKIKREMDEKYFSSFNSKEYLMN